MVGKQQPREFGWANTFVVAGGFFAVSAGLWLLMSLHHGLTASTYWSALAFGAVIAVPTSWFARPDRYQRNSDVPTHGFRGIARRTPMTIWWIVFTGAIWLLFEVPDGLRPSSFIWALVYAVVLVTASWWESRRDRRKDEASVLRNRRRIVAKAR